MRLDFLLAHATDLSRKEAKRAISTGAVRVDGVVCRQAASKIAANQRVCLDGVPVDLPGQRYLMLNKPAGVVSATRDAEHPTALGLLPAELQSGLGIVGRLDLDTTGLLLMTSDGQWSHRVTSPRRQCPKSYRVTLADAISDDMARRLRQGVELRNDGKPTEPAEVAVIDERVIDLTITEGRYHQVKRMLAAVGNHVTALHRWRIGDIRLDPTLAPGEFRTLTEGEIASID